MKTYSPKTYIAISNQSINQDRFPLAIHYGNRNYSVFLAAITRSSTFLMFSHSLMLSSHKTQGLSLCSSPSIFPISSEFSSPFLLSTPYVWNISFPSFDFYHKNFFSSDSPEHISLLHLIFKISTFFYNTIVKFNHLVRFFFTHCLCLTSMTNYKPDVASKQS